MFEEHFSFEFRKWSGFGFGFWLYCSFGMAEYSYCSYWFKVLALRHPIENSSFEHNITHLL